MLDSFMGSGTTAVACKRLERNFIGFEINPKYYEIAINRLKGITKEHIGEKSILDFMEEQ